MIKRHDSKNGNQGGYVLAAALIGLLVVSIVSIAIFAQHNSISVANKNEQVKQVLNSRLQELLTAIYNNEAWQTQTAVGNNCLLAGVGCAAGQAETPLILKDGAGNVLINSTSATSGLNQFGRNCSDYGLNDSTNCIFKYNVTWKPENCATTCKIRINVTLSYNQKSKAARFLINEKDYEYSFQRGFDKYSLQEACLKGLKGKFDQLTNTCLPDTNDQLICPAGQYMVKVNMSGVECRPSVGWGAQCPKGSAMIGFNSDGTLNCKSVVEWK